MGQAWAVIKEAFSDFLDDGAMTLAAALAFYSALSLAPLLVILLTVAGFLPEGYQASLVSQLASLVGPEASAGIEQVINSAQSQPDIGTWAGILGVVTLLFSASGVFAQLQAAMNQIFDVEPIPGRAIKGWLRTRALAVGAVFTILFLLLLSLAVSAVLSAVFSGAGGRGWQVLNLGVSLVVYFGLFAFIFRYLPDVELRWRETLVGAAVTAVLFQIGKWAIGLYLGNSSLGSSYGAAGSLIVLLVWVYYSSIILFLGAELTQAAAKRLGKPLRPSEHARPATRNKISPLADRKQAQEART